MKQINWWFQLENIDWGSRNCTIDLQSKSYSLGSRLAWCSALSKLDICEVIRNTHTLLATYIYIFKVLVMMKNSTTGFSVLNRKRTQSGTQAAWLFAVVCAPLCLSTSTDRRQARRPTRPPLLTNYVNAHKLSHWRLNFSRHTWQTGLQLKDPLIASGYLWSWRTVESFSSLSLHKIEKNYPFNQGHRKHTWQTKALSVQDVAVKATFTQSCRFYYPHPDTPY